ncbi:hypothetical protein TIFTF001_001547 [Ficus carica]|uniref:Uncharacterized protein n=1 Tax=Ficus carica TaxID=3494 RepID=A0AA87Z2B3_FICCA|nr:hypothetical protein TIFTF001_001547 [Ficus carica]
MLVFHAEEGTEIKPKTLKSTQLQVVPNFQLKLPRQSTKIAIRRRRRRRRRSKEEENRRTEEAKLTADAVVVGAATDGAAEDSGRVGGRIVGERDDRHANADGGSGAAVEAQNNVAGASDHRRLVLEVPDFAIPVPLLHRC